MILRPLRPSDIPSLKAIAQASGYPYPSPDDQRIVAVTVIADDQDRPMIAAAAHLIPEAYLWCRKGLSVFEQLAALRMIHEELAVQLKKQGFAEMNAFPPPAIGVKFGRRLERTFGWKRNVASWFKRF